MGYLKHTKSVIILFILFIYSQLVLSQETLTWTNNIPSGGWPGTTLGPHNNNSLCHSRGTLTALIANPMGFALPSGTPFPIAANNNSLALGMSGVPDAQGITQTLNFSYPVENLSFSIFDIDGNINNWQDRLIITASLAGTSVPITINTCPTAAGTICFGTGTNTARVDAGLTATGFTAADGRGDFSIAGALDTVTIQYLNHTIPTSTTQFISLTQLTYNCAIIGASKQMTRRAGQPFGISPYIVDIDFNFENYGDVTLSALTSIEDLDASFGAGNYTVTSISNPSGPGSFNANGVFDGNSNQELIATSSTLASGQTATISVALDVIDYGSYTNSISITGTTPQGYTISDDSTNGADADGADNDNNPDESTPSTLNTITLAVSLNYVSTSTSTDGINIEWQTDIEYDHVAYRIFQENTIGERITLSEMIYQPIQQQGQSLKTYSYSSPVNNNNSIWLAEYSKSGTTNWHGPFSTNDKIGNAFKNTEINWYRQNNNKSALNSKSLAIEVTKNGMHRINYDDLIQAGLDLSQALPNNIRITLGEIVIPLYINGNKQSFDASTSFDFYAQGIDTLYTDKRIYQLTINLQRGLSIKEDNTIPTSVINSWYWQHESYNPNLIYDFSSPTNDPWRAETLATFGTNQKNMNFPLDEFHPHSGKNISLKLEITGGINYQQVPEIYPTDPDRCGADHPDLYFGMPNDHCLNIKINDQDYADIVFDGLSHYQQDYLLNQQVTSNGVVNIDLNLPGGTGFDFDIINIESISMKYPRNLSAIDDVLQFTVADDKNINNDLINLAGFEVNGEYDITLAHGTTKAALLINNFSNDELIAYSLESNNPKRIKAGVVSSDGNQFSIKIPSIAQNNRYWISTQQGMLRPNLKPWHNTQIVDFSSTEYIIIAHPDFIDTASQLKEYHQQNGLIADLINVEDIYAQYSQSIIDPYAIKEFITELAKNSHLKFVLLIGADNYDYKGYLSQLHFSHIPSIYTAIDDVVRYAPSDSIYADINNDNIPDLAIGRLPVRNNQELQLLLDKQMKFINQGSQTLKTHFIADAADDNYSYAQISEDLSQLVPQSWTKLTSYRDNQNDINSTKQNILDNFSLSPRLTTYLGHSGPRNWFSYPSAFTYNDINSLENNTAASVILQWGCWNSYYVEPDANTMAHRFLFNNEKGAVAVFGASALTSVVSEKAFAEYIIPEMVKINQTIGESMLKAKQFLAEDGDFRDVIIGWNLLGDPALKLIY